MVLTKMFSEKGTVLLLYSNYKFRKCKILVSTGEELWRCANKSCKVQLYTLEDGTVLSKVSNEHNHKPLKEGLLNRQLLSNSIKRKIDEIDEKPRRLIQKEVKINTKTIDTLTQTDLQRIKNNITRARLQQHPKLPQSINEVHLAVNELNTLTVRDENFLLTNDQEFGIIIFSCDSNLQYLCEKKVVLMDGTFEYAAKYFLQLFTIHGYSDGIYVPLAFCLLKNKNKEIYIRLFQHVTELCNRRNFNFNPKTIVIDFEEAIHQSIKSVFPSTSITGCRFHLAQAWWRKIQSLGLVVTYKNENSELGKWLHYCFGLTYLEPEEVENGFCDLIAIQPQDEKLTEFADYLCDTYIDVNSPAVFPPQVWASNSVATWRTTNACESFHSKFNSSFNSPHPNIYLFVKNLQLVQTDTYVKINSFRQGIVPIKHKNIKYKLDFITKKLAQLQFGEIDRLHFVKCCSYKAAI